MSYNITAFKTQALLFGLPLTFDFLGWVRTQPESVGRRWCLEDGEIAIKTDLARSTWELTIFNQELSGELLEGHYAVRNIDWQGEFSGYLYGDILLPLFREFKGSLKAVVVWEGGDSLYRLNIHEGAVEEEEIK